MIGIDGLVVNTAKYLQGQPVWRSIPTRNTWMGFCCASRSRMRPKPP
jgi:hypothetical protein